MLKHNPSLLSLISRKPTLASIEVCICRDFTFPGKSLLNVTWKADKTGNLETHLYESRSLQKTETWPRFLKCHIGKRALFINTKFSAGETFGGFVYKTKNILVGSFLFVSSSTHGNETIVPHAFCYVIFLIVCSFLKNSQVFLHAGSFLNLEKTAEAVDILNGIN